MNVLLEWNSFVCRGLTVSLSLSSPSLSPYRVLVCNQCLRSTDSPGCNCCSVAKSCPTLCNPMACGVPGSSVLQYLSTFAQIHIHWVGDALCASQRMDFCLLLPSTFPSSRVFSLMVSTINTEEPVLANACCRGHILCSTLHPLSQQFGLTVAVVTSCPQV